MSKLDMLGRKYGTDKCSRWHNYTKYYYNYFLPFCEKKIRFLEIGVGRGASLRMWTAFFPNAEIFAIDNNPKAKQYVDKTISLFIGDQADPAFLNFVVKQTGGNWDIIIDDGGHFMCQQITSFETLFPHLKSNGVFVIEDLHTSYVKHFGGGYQQAGTTIEYLKNLIDELNKRGQASFQGRCCGDPVKTSPAIQKTKLNNYAYWIEAVHFYLSVCFILKSDRKKL